MVPLERTYMIFLAIFNFDGFARFIPLLVALLFLVVLSGFFSSAETAYSSLNIIRMRNYLEEKKKGAKKAVYIAEKFDLTLTTILVGNNLVNIAATTIAAFIFTSTVLDPTLANVLTTVIMTSIILVFGEIVPKSYSKEHAEKVALKYSGLLYIMIKVLYPITWLFIKLKKKLLKHPEFTTPYMTEDELESIIDVMENEGVIEKDDADLIQSAIALNERTVYDIMTPRVDVIAIEINDSIESIKQTFFEHQFSRIPVYKEDKDNMIGILSERDFFTAYIQSKDKNIKVEKLLAKPYFVSKSTKVDDLIREMQKMKRHFAIVSDEYGGTSGIVTMEDALEELVGEIYDEYDEEEDVDTITKIDENKYMIFADLDLEHFFEELKLGKEPTTQYPTVGGFVYELSEETPFSGQQVTYYTVYEEDEIENPIHNEYEITFTVDKVVNRRIKTLIVDVKLLESKNA